jgi:Transposase and inactivated derivatives
MIMDKKEYFEKILDRSTEELVKELFPNGIATQEKIGIRKLLESVVELIMNQERNFFLENDDDNKANGYYERSLNTGSFKLNINVPRDRKGRFRPQILPDPYKRVNEDYALGEKLAVFIKFKNEILRPYGLMMTWKV